MKKLRQLRKELDEEIQFKVDVEGMPPTFMTGRSSAEILAKLRKIVKQPSMIKSVERQTDVEVRKAFRNKAQGREMDEAVDATDTGGAEEVSMAMSQVKAMRHYLDGIEERVQAEGDMEEWFQNKLTKANDYLKTLYGYGKGKTNEAVTYHGNPNKDDDARNAARRRRLAKQDNLLRKRAKENEKARQALKDPSHNPAWANSKSKMEASVIPSKDGKKLVPMKKHSEPKAEPVPNSQFGLPRLKKTNEATYGTQAQRMMSPLQKARQDKEKADRDKDGKLHMMKGRPKKLGEISKDLAKSYHKKAIAPGVTKSASDLGHTKDSMRKTHNRVVGSNRAMDRMFGRRKTNEDNVNEISQDLKKRYTDKAKSDYGHQQYSADIAREMGAKDSEKYYRRKQRNRMAGITKASK